MACFLITLAKANLKRKRGISRRTGAACALLQIHSWVLDDDIRVRPDNCGVRSCFIQRLYCCNSAALQHLVICNIQNVRASAISKHYPQRWFHTRIRIPFVQAHPLDPGRVDQALAMASTLTSTACTSGATRSGGARPRAWQSVSCSRALPESISFRERIQRQGLVHLSISSSRRTDASGSRTFLVRAVRRIQEVEAAPFLGEDGKANEFPASPGVYAVYDKEGELQYVGLSRRVSTSIQYHLQELPELCGSVKVDVIDAPDRAALSEAWQAWMQEHIDATGKVPVGNVQGNTTWTERKAKRVKADLKLMPRADTKLNITLEQLLDTVVKSHSVVAFIKGSRTAPQCGFSHKVLTILNEQGVDYETVNVLDEEHNRGVREAIKTYSQWPTIPQLYVKGEFVGGADVLEELVTSGEIKNIFKK